MPDYKRIFGEIFGQVNGRLGFSQITNSRRRGKEFLNLRIRNKRKVGGEKR